MSVNEGSVVDVLLCVGLAGNGDDGGTGPRKVGQGRDRVRHIRRVTQTWKVGTFHSSAAT